LKGLVFAIYNKPFLRKIKKNLGKKKEKKPRQQKEKRGTRTIKGRIV
jgi:hypothetical protein